MSDMNAPVMSAQGGEATDAALDTEFEVQVDQLSLELEALLREQRSRPFLTDEEQYLLSEAAGELLLLYLEPTPTLTWKPG